MAGEKAPLSEKSSTVLTSSGEKKTIIHEPGGLVAEAIKLGGKVILIDGQPVIEDNEEKKLPVSPTTNNRIQ